MSSQIVRWTAALAAAFLLSVPSGASAQNGGPLGAGDNQAAKQAEANFGHYQFRDGESLDDLHIHYATMGQPHRNAAGDYAAWRNASSSRIRPSRPSALDSICRTRSGVMPRRRPISRSGVGSPPSIP